MGVKRPGCETTGTPLVSPPPKFLSREGPFLLTELAATSNHPLISAGLTGCPYHMTTYVRLILPVWTLPLVSRYTILGFWNVWVRRSPPAEWLSVMDHRKALRAALQLQRDAGLMLSNLTVVHQYAIALHRMSTEVLHTVFGQEFFP